MLLGSWKVVKSPGYMNDLVIGTRDECFRQQQPYCFT